MVMPEHAAVVILRSAAMHLMSTEPAPGGHAPAGSCSLSNAATRETTLAGLIACPVLGLRLNEHCSRTTKDQAAAPPSSMMNSRRFMKVSPSRDRADHGVYGAFRQALGVLPLHLVASS